MAKEKKDSKLIIAITVLNGTANMKGQWENCNPGDMALALAHLEVIKNNLIERYTKMVQGKKGN